MSFLLNTSCISNMPTMGNSILLPGPEHPGKTARMLWSLKFIRNLSGGTKNGAGLINLLCPYCPNHNTLKVLAKLNNAHTISFVLASFLLLIHWCVCSWQSRSPASLCLMIQCREITEQAPLRRSVNFCDSIPRPRAVCKSGLRGSDGFRSERISTRHTTPQRSSESQMDRRHSRIPQV